MRNNTNALIFKTMPDGTVPDYNTIYDATDEEFPERKMVDKGVERFLYQYADALRSHELVLDRIGCVEMGLDYDLKQYIRDPSKRIVDCLDREEEIPRLRSIWDVSVKEISDTRIVVADIICSLSDEQQRLILTAHYICGAKWSRISDVYGHQERWAKEKHNHAVKVIGSKIKTASEHHSDRDAALTEIARLEMKWKNDEFEWRMKKRKEQPTPDDIRLVFGA